MNKIINIVWAEGLTSEELVRLREEVEWSLKDPNYTIISNFEIHWTQVKLEERKVPRIVWADALEERELCALREQVDLAMKDPNYPIVANFKINVPNVEIVEEIIYNPVKLLNRYQILKEEC